MAKVSDNLTVVFGGNYRAGGRPYYFIDCERARRWYAEEIVMIEQERKAQKCKLIKNDLKEAAADLAQESA